MLISYLLEVLKYFILGKKSVHFHVFILPTIRPHKGPIFWGRLGYSGKHRVTWKVCEYIYQAGTI